MLSVYVHVPFCVKKCRYCGFYSTSYASETADDYLCALGREAERSADLFSGRPAGTVYIGGGTPTVLSAVQLEQLLSSLASHLPIAPGAEWTLEANPGSLSSSQLSVAGKWGVNRISLGVQSLSDDVLAFLGRPHRAQEASEAVSLVRNAGFCNLGMDLIYGIPGQTDRQWAQTLSDAIQMRPEHLSVYGLSLDQGSLFSMRASKGAFALPDDDSVVAQYLYARQELRAAGYEHYEVSNFALPGFHCRHNLNYWSRGEYLGLGPGSWAFFEGRRWSSITDIAEYCRRLQRGKSVVDQQETLTAQDAASEMLMLGLRTARGVDLSAYEKQFGSAVTERMARNAEGIRTAGLLKLCDGRLMLTSSGFLVANEVIRSLLP